MTFLRPWWLVLLGLVAALVLGLVLAMRRRSRYAIAFTDTELLRSVMPRRPGWRRHLPPALMLLGITALTLGLAEPAIRTTGSVPERLVVLAVDVSPSMMATDVPPTRFEVMDDAVRTFVDDLPTEVHLGLVSFAGTARVEVAPTREHEAIVDAMEQLEFRSNTSLAQAVLTSLTAIETAASPAERLPASIVLLSDGDSNVEPPLPTGIEAARDAEVPVSTIALGTPDGVITLSGDRVPVPVATDELSRLAEETGGAATDAASQEELRTIYGDIGGSFAGHTELRSIADWFFVASLLGLVAAGALSLRWFSGLP
ncbi:VWA domain-containing protein [Haloechinothrix sp. LS1_15]|uniref:VWA domain-containing protein n=1 Tax=Haloechinothrix sp. LS1_15 TaxID=2652248 RepID=UPI002944E657|nr:VWA domain-containing protein [Haloechinothrix sp. LS1_15]MDV6013620.1 VWA domain-containing protein [Haloechinothrix sp. LS1_15]